MKTEVLKSEICKEFGVAETALSGKRHLENAKNAQACMALVLVTNTTWNITTLSELMCLKVSDYSDLVSYGVRQVANSEDFRESYHRIKDKF